MGFVKLDDDLKEWEYYGDNNTLSLYIRLLMSAAWKDCSYRGVNLRRGQVLTTIRELATNNQHTVQQTRNNLKRLEATSKITIQATPRYSIITVLAVCEQDENNKPNNKETTQTTTKKQHKPQQRNNKHTLLLYNNTDIQNTDIQILPAKNDVVESVENVENSVENVEKSKKCKQPEKEKYAEYVQLSENEYTALVGKVGEIGAKRCIEILDNYKGASGKQYKSDYRAILNWVIERYKDEQSKQQTRPQPRNQAPQQPKGASSFDVDAVMRRIQAQYKQGRSG